MGLKASGHCAKKSSAKTRTRFSLLEPLSHFRRPACLFPDNVRARPPLFGVLSSRSATPAADFLLARRRRPPPPAATARSLRAFLAVPPVRSTAAMYVPPAALQQLCSWRRITTITPAGSVRAAANGQPLPTACGRGSSSLAAHRAARPNTKCAAPRPPAGVAPKSELTRAGSSHGASTLEESSAGLLAASRDREPPARRRRRHGRPKVRALRCAVRCLDSAMET